MTYFDAEKLIFVRCEIKTVVGLAENKRWQCKLHLDARINRANVVVQGDVVQSQSNVDVSTNTSVWNPVEGDSRSLSVVDRTSHTLVQLIAQVLG